MSGFFHNLIDSSRSLLAGSSSSAPETPTLEVQVQRCMTCHNLDWRTDPLPDGAWRPTNGQEGFRFKVSGSSLDTSAAAGCQTCTILIIVAENVWAGRRMDWIEFNIALIRDQTPKIGQVSEAFYSVELYVPTDDTSKINKALSWQNIPYRADISTSPASTESFTFIQDSLNTCLASHPTCHSQTSVKSTPRRLLEICDPTHVRLIDLTTIPISDPIPYTALSYCWGTGKFFRTFTTNVDELSQPFSRDRLPVVLAEAVQITEKLGLKHIWIDALCILQDSATDWEIESAKMGVIYERAHLTIAASSSNSVDTPFLTTTPRADDTRRPVGRTDNLRLNVKDQNTNRSGLWRTKGLTTTVAARRVPTSGFHNDADLEPWSERGWTFQEAVLPTRLVSFTADEVQWSCKTVKTCECRTREPQRQLPLPWLTENQELHEGKNAIDDKDVELARFWTEMAERYSRRKFTFYKDKLVAIAGIASVLHSLAPTRRKYVAGLWTSNLIYEMCWVSVGIGGPAEPVLDAPGYMPTFSWASIKDDIKFVGSLRSVNPTTAFKARAEVVKVDVDASENLPFGVFKHVAVTLKSALIPCKVIRECQWDRPPMYRLDFGVERGHLRSFSEDADIEAGFVHTGYEVSDERVAVRSKLAPSSTKIEETPGGGNVKDVRGERETKKEELNAFLFYMADVQVGSAEWAYFLVLGKSEGKKGSYERLGMWNVDLSGGKDTQVRGLNLNHATISEVVIV